MADVQMINADDVCLLLSVLERLLTSKPLYKHITTGHVHLLVSATQVRTSNTTSSSHHQPPTTNDYHTQIAFRKRMLPVLAQCLIVLRMIVERVGTNTGSDRKEKGESANKEHFTGANGYPLSLPTLHHCTTTYLVSLTPACRPVPPRAVSTSCCRCCLINPWVTTLQLSCWSSWGHSLALVNTRHHTQPYQR